ncbi:hypothetical protein MMC27_000484 [Xylographa pallens]|nr:hypothetical protein [Xylographa pallens]
MQTAHAHPPLLARAPPFLALLDAPCLLALFHGPERLQTRPATTGAMDEHEAQAYQEVGARDGMRVHTGAGPTRAVLAALHLYQRVRRYVTRIIVVEKLTKNVNEAHLREIFGAYGPIREVDLPMNRQSY